MYRVKEAASKLGLSEQHTRYLLVKGEVKGKLLGHDWAALSVDYKRRGRPKRARGGK
jgi:hypothetical protein